MSNFNFTTLFPFNRVAKFFQKGRELENAEIIQTVKNSQGVSQEELDRGAFLNYEGIIAQNQSITYTGTSFEQYFNNKVGRIQKYKEMALYPEISDALDMVCDDAIVDNPKGDVISLNIKDEVPTHIEEKIREEWQYLMHEVFGVNERSWDMFRKWIVESELYIELVTNDEGNKISGIKILPSHTMMPVYENNMIVAYMQTKKAAKTQDILDSTAEEHSTLFDQDQVVYTNYGITGENLIDVRGFLEPAIRVYNQLKQIEDSLVIYRLVKSPMRRIFNVQTPGRMPPQKAMEYLRNTVKEYRKKVIYNPETGMADSAANIQTLTEDFWFIKNEGGEGTSVETMGENTGFLGEIDDVKYFLVKLNKALKIPKARWEESNTAGYNVGKSGEITREEIKFAKFVQRLQRRFKFIFLDAFITHLRMTGMDSEYLDVNKYDVEYTQSNLFNDYRELELTNTKVQLLGSIDPYMYSPSKPEGMFAREYVLKRFLMISDEELEVNKKMLEAEKQESKKEAKNAPTTPAPEAGMEMGAPAPTGTEIGGGGNEVGGAPAPEAGATAPAPEAGAPPVQSLFAGAPPAGTAEGALYDSPVLREWRKSF